ncbi:hypothetical protein C8J56DRAFT_942797 [Mycena floridula]|nr:hypothetical protein C8J56DRAFT_942797 [Mycena floridula]
MGALIQSLHSARLDNINGPLFSNNVLTIYQNSQDPDYKDYAEIKARDIILEAQLDPGGIHHDMQSDGTPVEVGRIVKYVGRIFDKPHASMLIHNYGGPDGYANYRRDAEMLSHMPKQPGMSQIYGICDSKHFPAIIFHNVEASDTSLFTNQDSIPADSDEDQEPTLSTNTNDPESDDLEVRSNHDEPTAPPSGKNAGSQPTDDTTNDENRGPTPTHRSDRTPENVSKGQKPPDETTHDNKPEESEPNVAQPIVANGAASSLTVCMKESTISHIGGDAFSHNRIMNNKFQLVDAKSVLAASVVVAVWRRPTRLAQVQIPSQPITATIAMGRPHDCSHDCYNNMVVTHTSLMLLILLNVWSLFRKGRP